MKLIKIEKKSNLSIILILGLILFSLICQLISSEKVSLKNKSKKIKIKRKTSSFNNASTIAPKFLVYRDEYYNFCTRASDSGFMFKDQCSEIYIEDKFHFPCDSNLEKTIENIRNKYSLLHSKENLPTATYEILLEKSTCKDQIGFFDKIYKSFTDKLFGQNEMLFEFKIALLRDFEGFDRDKKFFENSKQVLVFNPVGKAIGLNFIFKQLNFSFELLNKSRFLNNPIKLLDETKDLKIQKAALYVSSFVGLIDAYHQLLYICALDSTGRALHFFVDRGAKPFSQSITFKTKVRIILYHISSKCGNAQDMPDDPQFNFNFKLLRQGANQHLRLDELKSYLGNNKGEIFKAIEPIGKDIPLELSSFNKLVVAIQRYAIRYENYNLLENCQHFATGFYNILTRSNIHYLNEELMKSFPLTDVSKDPFIIFFQDLSDEEFLKHARRLQELNQKRKMRLEKKLRR